MSLALWICGTCSHINRPPMFLSCASCGSMRKERHASVHSSERAVAYINPRTGERRIPATATALMPEVYARQGYERVEIDSMSAFERQTGLVHEASNYGSNGLNAERDTTSHVEDAPDLSCLDDPSE